MKRLATILFRVLLIVTLVNGNVLALDDEDEKASPKVEIKDVEKKDNGETVIRFHPTLITATPKERDKPEGGGAGDTGRDRGKDKSEDKISRAEQEKLSREANALFESSVRRQRSLEQRQSGLSDNEGTVDDDSREMERQVSRVKRQSSKSARRSARRMRAPSVIEPNTDLLPGTTIDNPFAFSMPPGVDPSPGSGANPFGVSPGASKRVLTTALAHVTIEKEAIDQLAETIQTTWIEQLVEDLTDRYNDVESETLGHMEDLGDVDETGQVNSAPSAQALSDIQDLSEAMRSQLATTLATRVAPVLELAVTLSPDEDEVIDAANQMVQGLENIQSGNYIVGGAQILDANSQLGALGEWDPTGTLEDSWIGDTAIDAVGGVVTGGLIGGIRNVGKLADNIARQANTDLSQNVIESIKNLAGDVEVVKVYNHSRSLPAKVIEDFGEKADEATDSFLGGVIVKTKRPSGTTLYRRGSDQGKFWSLDRKPPEQTTALRIDKAITPKMKSTEDLLDPKVVTIPAGEEWPMYEGVIRSQGGIYVGGTYQVILPDSLVKSQKFKDLVREDY